MESCPEARDLGGFNLLADKAALGGEEASLAARRSRFSIELLSSLLLLLSLSSTGDTHYGLVILGHPQRHETESGEAVGVFDRVCSFVGNGKTSINHFVQS